MARQVKVFNDNISTINSEIDKLIEELNHCFQDIQNNGTLINEKWKGAAAVKAVAGINKSAKDLKKATDEIKDVKAHVKSTSKAITEADDTIKKQFQAIVG